MIDQGIVADDKEVSSIANVDIDIFSDGNYLDLEDKVEAIMIQNNFIRVGSSPDMFMIFLVKKINPFLIVNKKK